MATDPDRELAIALDLVGRAYEAAAQPGLWPQFLHALADATECEGTVIWLHDATDDSARLSDSNTSFLGNVRMATDFAKSYAEYYTHRNLLLGRLNALTEGSVMNSSTAVPSPTLHRSEYYNDWLRPQGVGYCLGGPILKRGSSVAMLSLARLEKRGAFTDCRRALD